MTETSYHWDGTAIGDATLAPYHYQAWNKWWSSILVMDKTLQGVFPSLNPDFNGNLECTDVGGNNLQIDTGIAMVDGTLYFNDAAITINLPPPGAGTDYWIIILRKDYGAYTVRATKVGPVAGGPFPSLTQDAAGVTQWEILLAEVWMSSTGTMTIFDQRQWISRPEMRFLWIPVMDASEGANKLYPEDAQIELVAGLDTVCHGAFACPQDKTKDTVAYLYSACEIASGAIGDVSTIVAANWGNLLAGTVASRTAAKSVSSATIRSSNNTTGQELFWNGAGYVTINNPANLINVGDIAEVFFQRSGSDPLDNLVQGISFVGWIFAYQGI